MTHDGLEWDLQLNQQEQGVSGLVPYFSHARRVKMNRFAKNLSSSISMIQVALVCFSVVVVSGSPVLAQNGPSASAVEIFQSIDRAGLSGPVLSDTTSSNELERGAVGQKRGEGNPSEQWRRAVMKAIPKRFSTISLSLISLVSFQLSSRECAIGAWITMNS